MLQIPPGKMRPHAAAIPRDRISAGRRAALAALVVAIALVIGGGIWTVMRGAQPSNSPTTRIGIASPRSSVPPLPPPLKEGFMPLDPAKAELINAGIPVSTAPLEPARPFVVLGSSATLLSRQSAADCLTTAIYYEAASESTRGQRAVAQVVLNRVRHPAFPKSVCGVVYEGAERNTGCQFSFTCDGSLARKPSQAGWDRARGVALAALAGFVEPSVGTATHYHTVWVVPYWASSLDKITTLGAHIFYRWQGYWGKRGAFTGVYAGEDAKDLASLVLPEQPPLLSADSVGTILPLGGPRLAADDAAGSLTAAPQQTGAAIIEPRADRESGSLVADENAGTLAGTAPKGAVTKGPAAKGPAAKGK